MHIDVVLQRRDKKLRNEVRYAIYNSLILSIILPTKDMAFTRNKNLQNLYHLKGNKLERIIQNVAIFILIIKLLIVEVIINLISKYK